MNLQDPQATGRQNAEAVGTWRVTYAPGEWVALAGPDALVVMPPAPARAQDFLTRLWEAIVPTASIDDLIAELASAGVTEMPDMLALFWDRGSMHSLIRGRLRLVDPASGEVVASGEGVRTWSETGLAGLGAVLVVADEEPGTEELQLPLVVGGARVGSLLVETSADRLVSCPAAAPRGTAPAQPEPTDQPEQPAVPVAAPAAEVPEVAEVPVDAGPDAPHGQVYDPMHPESDEPRTVEQPAVAEPEPEAAPEPEPEPEAATELMAGPEPEPEAATELMAGADIEPEPEEPAPQQAPLVGTGGPQPSSGPPPVMAVLRPITGAPVTVDRPVLIGRAPDPAKLGSDLTPKLMTVPSPSHDISRTHVKVEPVGRTVQVTDLHSTNGTVLITGPVGGDPSVAGQRHPMVPGEPVAVQPGWILDLGDGVTILIDRA